MNYNVTQKCACPVCQEDECYKLPNISGRDGECYKCARCAKYAITGRVLGSDDPNGASSEYRKAFSQKIRSCSDSCSGNEIPIVDNNGLLQVRKGVW